MSILNPLRSNNQSSSHIACETFQRVFHLNYPKFIPEKRDEPNIFRVFHCVCVCVWWREGRKAGAERVPLGFSYAELRLGVA